MTPAQVSEWRELALACVERAWPGQLPRSERQSVRRTVEQFIEQHKHCPLHIWDLEGEVRPYHQAWDREEVDEPRHPDWEGRNHWFWDSLINLYGWSFMPDMSQVEQGSVTDCAIACLNTAFILLTFEFRSAEADHAFTMDELRHIYADKPLGWWQVRGYLTVAGR